MKCGRLCADRCMLFRRGVRVVEGARLESVYTGNGIAGSNPALSARGRRSFSVGDLLILWTASFGGRSPLPCLIPFLRSPATCAKAIAAAQDLRSRPLIYRAEIYRRLFERGRPSAVEVRCPLLLVLVGAVAMAKAPKLYRDRVWSTGFVLTSGLTLKPVKTFKNHIMLTTQFTPGLLNPSLFYNLNFNKLQ